MTEQQLAELFQRASTTVEAPPDVLSGVAARGRQLVRRRRARRAGGGVAAALVVAGAGAGVAAISGSTGTSAMPLASHSEGGAVAANKLPSTESLHSGTTLALPSGRVAVVHWWPGHDRPAVNTARSILFVYPDGTPASDVTYLSAHWPSIASVPQRTYDEAQAYAVAHPGSASLLGGPILSITRPGKHALAILGLGRGVGLVSGTGGPR